MIMRPRKWVRGYYNCNINQLDSRDSDHDFSVYAMKTSSKASILLGQVKMVWGGGGGGGGDQEQVGPRCCQHKRVKG